MEVIADLLVEILPTTIGDWMAVHLFGRMSRKVKSKALRLVVALLVLLLVLAIGVGFALLCIVGLVKFLY